MAVQVNKSSGTAGKGKPAPLPRHERKGIFIDAAARQYGTRIGYRLDEETGRRVRSNVQRLGADRDEATIQHLALQREWEALCENWPRWSRVIAEGMPDKLKDADLSKPVWLRQQWIDAAKVAHKDALAETVVGYAEQFTAKIDAGKAGLEVIAQPAQKWLDLVPDGLRARVLQALQPAANEVMGLAPDARRLTIREAADEYIEYKRGKVGLKVRGRRSGGGIKPGTFRQAQWSLESALKLLDASAGLDTLTHVKLEEVIDRAYQKARSPATARNHMKHGLKPMLDWCHRRPDVLFRKGDETDELFALSKVISTKIVGYSPETAAKLKLLKASAEGSARGRGQPLWPFALLALNCGALQADIGSWTYDDLRFHGEDEPFMWWRRVKTEDVNAGLRVKHVLWPETWDAIKPLLAPRDAKVNPNRLLFLSTTGGPMHRAATQERARTDLIGLRFKRVLDTCKDEEGENVKLGLSFKSLRKISLNAVKFHSGGSDDVTRKHAGQRVPGVLRNYLLDDYDDVSAALGRWRDQLRADKLL